LQGGTNSRIDLILQEIALTDCDAVQDGLNRALALLEHVIQHVEESLATLSEGERRIAKDVLGACWEEVRRFRDDASVVDVVSF
jgi:hypothetical protein